MSETFGQRLSRIRKEKGMTQEDIAKRITISPQAVSKWENDISSPDILILSNLADILGVSVDELLGREEGSSKVHEEPKNEEEEKPEASEVVDDDETVNEESIRINKEGIHVIDDDGKKIHVGNDGIIIEENGKTRKVKYSDKVKENKKFIITTSTLFGLALIGYIVMGLLWTDQTMGWKMGWILLLVHMIIGSIFSCIKHKRFCDFAYPILVVAAYCTLGFLGMYFNFRGWDFYWFLFLTIPAFYLIFGPIDRYIHRNDVRINYHYKFDDDKDEENDEE